MRRSLYFPPIDVGGMQVVCRASFARTNRHRRAVRKRYSPDAIYDASTAVDGSMLHNCFPAIYGRGRGTKNLNIAFKDAPKPLARSEQSVERMTKPSS